jgi:hypothetical protein
MNLQEVRPHVVARAFWDLNGFQETGYVHIDNHWEFKGGATVKTGMNITREGLLEAFEIFPGVVVPPGTYDHREAILEAWSNLSAPFSVRVLSTIGGFFGGDRVSVAPQVQFRVGETFNASLRLVRNDITLPNGSFVTNLSQLRISYSFSPQVFLQGLVQYNDRDEIWSTNLRFGWLQRANTGLFIVYNDVRGLGDFISSSIGRSLTLKLSRMFDVLD